MCWPPEHPMLKRLEKDTTPKLLLCHRCGRLAYLPPHPTDQYEVYKNWYSYYDDKTDKNFYLCCVCVKVIERGE